MAPSSIWKVEYLTRLMFATAAFEHHIRKRIPEGVVVRDRNGSSQDIDPRNKFYKRALEKFTEDVSDVKSMVILCFLYQYEQYLSKDWELFEKHYRIKFSGQEDKWDSIKYNFPKLNQSTLGKILNQTFSETMLGYRVEDLSRVGLIGRSTLKPPNPKHVWISEGGISAVEAAIRDGADALASVFGNRENPSETPGQHSVSRSIR